MSNKLTIGVTGHRLHLLPGYTGEARQRLRALLLELAMERLEDWSPDLVITGMATGWDMAVAAACMFRNTPFRAYVPFHGQEKLWSKSDKAMYHQLLEEAEDVRVFSPVQANAAYHQRDRAIVDDSSRMLTLYLGDPATGTGKTLAYADDWLVPWSNVAEEFLDRLQNGKRPEA